MGEIDMIGEVVTRGTIPMARSEYYEFHGMSGHPAREAWKNIKARCTNPNNPQAKDYMERGITLHSDWYYFSNFWRDMGPTWRRGLTIERIDNDGNYEPGNCCWATRKEQNRNLRRNIWINTPDGLMICKDACATFGISYKSVCTLHWKNNESHQDVFDRLLR